MKKLMGPITLGLLSYAGVLVALWWVVPLWLQDALTDWVTWFPLLLWLPALIVGGYVAGRSAGERGLRSSFIVGFVATLVSLRVVKVHVPFLWWIGLALVGGLISAAAGFALRPRGRRSEANR